MKKFPFKYSALIIILLIAVSAIFGASAALNTVNAVNSAKIGVTETVFHGFLAILSFAMFLFSVAAMVFGNYSIKNGYLYCRFGILYSKTPIKDIFQLTEFKAMKKLVAYIAPEKYTVIVVKEKYFTALFEELKKINPEIIYTFSDSASVTENKE